MAVARIALLAGAAALALAACKTPEEELVDRRRELRATLDDAYSEYARGAPQPPPEGSDPGMLGRLVGEVDRALFEHQCLSAGRGERTFGVSARLDAFLKEDRNARTCRRAADLDAEVAALERKVGADRR